MRTRYTKNLCTVQQIGIALRNVAFVVVIERVQNLFHLMYQKDFCNNDGTPNSEKILQNFFLSTVQKRNSEDCGEMDDDVGADARKDDGDE